jgi:hypothetical protein
VVLYVNGQERRFYLFQVYNRDIYRQVLPCFCEKWLEMEEIFLVKILIPLKSVTCDLGDSVFYGL